jgi:hypothetical protein
MEVHMAKGKSLLHYCPHCEREAKMEVIGASEAQPDRTWYRCTRCRHALVVNLEEYRKVQEEAKKKPDPDHCTQYDPGSTYAVGQAIFHSEWQDVGKIISKERTSGGARSIVVSFEKLGERRLLESVLDNLDQPE